MFRENPPSQLQIIYKYQSKTIQKNVQRIQSSRWPAIRRKYKHYYIQGNPQRMRHQRRLYENSTLCFLKIMIPCNCKIINKVIYKLDIISNSTLISSYFKSFRLYLQSHPLWVTLQIRRHWTKTTFISLYSGY